MNLNLEELVTLNEDPEETFELLDVIGFGSYGVVYKALHRSSGEIYAVKIGKATGEIDALKKEIQIMQDCQSDYIVRYFASYIHNGQLWLIMEYCAAGSIIDLIRITGVELNEIQIACIMHSALLGLFDSLVIRNLRNFVFTFSQENSP